MKKTVYLDTSIPSYLFDDRESIKTYVDITKKWWQQEKDNFKIWISEETFNELSKGDYPRKTEVLQFVSEIALLQPEEEIT